MEKTLNMGAFEALDQQEMYDVDGGLFGKLVICLGVMVVCYFIWCGSVS